MTMNKHWKALLVMVVAYVGLSQVAALAHGEIAGSDPADGARLKSPPKEVSVTYSEAPADADRFKVTDGCGNKVVQTASVEGDAITAQIVGGEPGSWLVEWKIVSAEDGHPSDGSISFRVAGKPDCAKPKETSKSTEAAPPPSDGGEDDGGGSAIFLWLGVGTVALVVVALLLRRTTS